MASETYRKLEFMADGLTITDRNAGVLCPLRVCPEHPKPTCTVNCAWFHHDTEQGVAKCKDTIIGKITQ